MIHDDVDYDKLVEKYFKNYDNVNWHDVVRQMKIVKFEYADKIEDLKDERDKHISYLRQTYPDNSIRGWRFKKLIYDTKQEYNDKIKALRLERDASISVLRRLKFALKDGDYKYKMEV